MQKVKFILILVIVIVLSVFIEGVVGYITFINIEENSSQIIYIQEVVAENSDELVIKANEMLSYKKLNTKEMLFEYNDVYLQLKKDSHLVHLVAYDNINDGVAIGYELSNNKLVLKYINNSTVILVTIMRIIYMLLCLFIAYWIVKPCYGKWIKNYKE